MGFDLYREFDEKIAMLGNKKTVKSKTKISLLKFIF